MLCTYIYIDFKLFNYLFSNIIIFVFKCRISTAVNKMNVKISRIELPGNCTTKNSIFISVKVKLNEILFNFLNLNVYLCIIVFIY